jgi:hypothetical protein
MPSLIITIDSEDHSDLQWLQPGSVAAVEEYVDDQRERLNDKNTEVIWEYKD